MGTDVTDNAGSRGAWGVIVNLFQLLRVVGTRAPVSREGYTGAARVTESPARGALGSCVAGFKIPTGVTGHAEKFGCSAARHNGTGDGGVVTSDNEAETQGGKSSGVVNALRAR